MLIWQCNFFSLCFDVFSRGLKGKRWIVFANILNLLKNILTWEFCAWHFLWMSKYLNCLNPKVACSLVIQEVLWILCFPFAHFLQEARAYLQNGGATGDNCLIWLNSLCKYFLILRKCHSFQWVTRAFLSLVVENIYHIQFRTRWL